MRIEQRENVVEHIIHLIRMLFQIFIDIVLQNVRIMLRLEAESINERPNAVKPRFALSVLRDRTGGGGHHCRRHRQCRYSFR